MRTHRRSLVSTPSQKSLSHATQDSQVDTSIGYFMPNNISNSQRRFTRKNFNTSQEKSKSRVVTQYNPDTSLSSVIRNQTPKISKQKPFAGLVKVNTSLKDSKISQRQPAASIVRTGSFTMNRVRQTRISNLEDTIRISQQKHTSRQSNKSSDSYASKCGARSNNVAVLKTQLELKEKQLMVLEDERRRFRNSLEDMKRREALLLQQVGKCEEEAKKMRESFKENILDLEKKLEQYSSYNKKLEEEATRMKKQLLQSQKQKKIIEKQLNLFITRQIPKNVRDFQSCRQISLEMTIQDLKSELAKNKTQSQKQMQIIIIKLRQETISLKDEVRTIQIKNRLMQKKSCDSQRYLQAYTSIKQQYKTLRSKLKQVNQQSQLLRNQNIKLKKQIKKLISSGKKPLERKNPEIIKRMNIEKEIQSSMVSERSIDLSISNCST